MFFYILSFPLTFSIANDNVTRSHALRKSGMQFDHRHKDKERPCECAHKRSCTRGKESGSKMDASGRKGVRRYRSRHKRKGKCNWLINCCGRFCICAKIPGNSMESDVYVKSHAHRNCECCSRSCNNVSSYISTGKIRCNFFNLTSTTWKK